MATALALFASPAKAETCAGKYPAVDESLKRMEVQTGIPRAVVWAIAEIETKCAPIYAARPPAISRDCATATMSLTLAASTLLDGLLQLGINTPTFPPVMLSDFVIRCAAVVPVEAENITTSSPAERYAMDSQSLSAYFPFDMLMD